MRPTHHEAKGPSGQRLDMTRAKLEKERPDDMGILGFQLDPPRSVLSRGVPHPGRPPGTPAVACLPWQDSTPFRAADAVPPNWELPRNVAEGKSSAHSLMQPQFLAHRLLPAPMYCKLVDFATRGCPVDTGEPWPKEVIDAARTAGPHVSALTPDNVKLIWDEVDYQVQAKFVKLVPDHTLFGPDSSKEIKISRLAVVPQVDRRGRLILNLSAPVELRPTRSPGARRKRKRLHPSVNETTKEVEDQDPVKALGTAMNSILHFCFDTPPHWEIYWQKIDLSDGFWRMIVQAGKEYNFVYEMPPRPKDGGKRFYVVPSSLQMGWKNSPVYFCTATEAGRELLRRLLALSHRKGPIGPHKYEEYCLSQMIKDLPTWSTPDDMAVLCRVFVDDYINGLAGPVRRPSRLVQELWLCRAALTAIHGIFPTPEILNHKGGRDSVSLRKLKKGDAKFDPVKILLGFLVGGGPGKYRQVGIPKDKAARYVREIDIALERPQRWISFQSFQKIHGKLVHASTVLPCMRGFMSVLNKVLSRAPQTVGLGLASELRPTFQAYRFFIQLAGERPSHISEIVGPDLPHVYGYIDASRGGLGGTCLPATRWLHPSVWRLEVPKDIKNKFDNNEVSINDLEAAAHFIGKLLIIHLLDGQVEGVSSWFGSDNKATVSWGTKMSDRGSSKSAFAPVALRAQALLQRYTRMGPQDIDHIPGVENDFGDFPSRSYEQGFPADGEQGDIAFFKEFTHRHHLPPQLGRWQLVRPHEGITFAIFSMLRGMPATSILPTASTGGAGLSLPPILANTLTYREPRPIPTTWNEACCSWPLLSHSGAVDFTLANRLGERQSRRPFANAHSAWSIKDFATLEKQLRGSPGSTQHSPRT